MAHKVGGMFVSLAASAARFKADMTSARQEGKKTAAGLNSSFKGSKKSSLGLSKSLGSLKGMLIGVAGPAALGYLIKKSIDAADAIAKAADAIGISTDALQELSFAADLAGISKESLTSALKAFTKRVGEAKHGTGTLITILQKMDEELLANVQQAENTEEAFDLIVRKASEMENHLDRAALLAAAFGRTAGVDMANMLKKGVEGIDEMRQKARDLDIVIDEKLLRSSEAAKDALTILGKVISTKLTSAVIQFTPQITNMATRFTEGLPALFLWVNKFLEWIGLLEPSPLKAAEQELIGINQRLKDMSSMTPFEFDLQEQTQGAIEFKGTLLKVSNWLHKLIVGEKKMAEKTEELTEQRDEQQKVVDDLKAAEKARFDAAMSQSQAETEAQLGILKTRQEMERIEKDREKSVTEFNKLYKEMITDQFDLERQKLTENVERFREAGASETEIARYESEERKKIAKAESEYKAEQLTKLTEVQKIGLQTISSLANKVSTAFLSAGTSGASAAKAVHTAWHAALRSLAAQIIGNAFIMMVLSMFGGPAGGALISKAGGPLTALLGGISFGRGAVFGPLGLKSFQHGTIIDRPTLISTRGGIGQMGEKGDEAIMPLTRLPGGDLGVRAEGGGQIILRQEITFTGNITDEDFVNKKVAPILEDASRKGLNKIQTK